MLTPTDTHYVAGLLTLTASPAGVEVEVGSMVKDVAAEIARDVDVTIRAKDHAGQVILLAGHEVKAHRRPLDSTHVEQLACKLKDMPGLGSRGIVSASGYTAPAVRKAAKHGILLYELVELPSLDAAFDHFQANAVRVTQRGLEWFGALGARVNPRHRTTSEEETVFRRNPPVRFYGKRRDPACKNLEEFIRFMQLHALNELMKDWPEAEQVAGRSKRAHVVMNVASFQAAIVKDEINLPIEEIVFDGEVRWRVETQSSRCMVLRQRGSSKPEAGCCVFESAGWGLCGLVVSNTHRELRFMHIPVTDRKKKKIYRQVLWNVVPAAPVEAR